MSEYSKTNKTIGILIVVLFIATMIGWSAFAGRGDTIKECQDQIKDLEREIDDLREQVYWVSDERDQYIYLLRQYYQTPLDLSGLTPTRSHSAADIIRDSQFWNVLPGEGELRQRDIEESYEKTLTSEIMLMGVGLYEWDILEEITSAWESLDAKGITSVIMVDTFSEANRIWLIVLWTKEALDTGTGWGIVIEPVTGKKYTPYISQDPETRDALLILPEDLIVYCRGYAYTSVSDLRADIEGR